MFVCICNQVTDNQIRQAVAEGATSLNALSNELKVGTCCGKCKSCAKNIMRSALQENMHIQTMPGGNTPVLSPV